MAVADHCLRGLKMKLSNPRIIRRMAAVERIVRTELKVLEKRLALSHSAGERTGAFGGSSLLDDSVKGSVLSCFCEVKFFRSSSLHNLHSDVVVVNYYRDCQ